MIYQVVGHFDNGAHLLHPHLPSWGRKRALAWGFARVGLPPTLVPGHLFIRFDQPPWAISVHRLGSRRALTLTTTAWQAAGERNLRTLAHLTPSELVALALDLPAITQREREEAQQREERLAALAELKPDPAPRSRRSPLAG